jgi:hypothetical protein
MSEKDNSVPPLSFEIERQARIKRSFVIHFPLPFPDGT